MILFDYVSFSPLEELETALEQTPSTEYAQMGSLKGRAVCIWKTCYHAAALILKPAAYIMLGLLFCAMDSSLRQQYDEKVRIKFMPFGSDLVLTGLVAPLGQITLLFKAVMGILHPGFYFKENEFDHYFAELAKLAQELGCEQDLVDLFTNGPSTIAASLQTGGSHRHYEALFKRDLALICSKLQETELSDDEKMGILNMFGSLPSDIRGSALQGCSPGIGRLFEQICSSLDVPQDLVKVLPWLEIQLKQEILHQMVMQHEGAGGSYLQLIDIPELADAKIDAAHFGNILIKELGDEIDLPQNMIDEAEKDLLAKFNHLIDKDVQELLDLFNQKYTEKVFADYLVSRINSQPDGRPGLKNFRQHIIQALSETVSEDKLEASKKEVQDKFKVGEAVSDDPIFYVKLHYFLYPEVDPSDEKATDLNEEGIRAFAATMIRDPFAYFVEKKLD